MAKYIFILCVILSINIITGCTSSTFRESVKKGDIAMQEKRYSDSIIAYSSASFEEPNNIEVKSKLKDAETKFSEERQINIKKNTMVQNKNDITVQKNENNIEPKKVQQSKTPLSSSDSIPSLGINQKDLVTKFNSSLQPLLKKMDILDDINLKEVRVLQDGYFSGKLTNTISFIGVLTPEGLVRWVGIRSEISSTERSSQTSMKQFEESVKHGNIVTLATIALISALGDEKETEKILENIINQQYNEFKEQGEYVSKRVKYVDASSKDFSLFMAINPNDKIDLGKYR